MTICSESFLKIDSGVRACEKIRRKICLSQIGLLDSCLIILYKDGNSLAFSLSFLISCFLGKMKCKRSQENEVSFPVCSREKCVF